MKPSFEDAPRSLLAIKSSLSVSKISHRLFQVGLTDMGVFFEPTEPTRAAKNLDVFGGSDSSSSCHSEDLEPSAHAFSILVTRRIAAFFSSVPRDIRTGSRSMLPTTE